MPSIHFATIAPHHAAVPNAALLYLHPAALRHRGLLPCAGAGARHPAGLARDSHHLDYRQDRGDPVCRSARVEAIPFDKSKGWRGYRNLWRTLKGRKFDALLHLQAALRASIATLGIKAKLKLGFDKARANDGQWLFTNHQVPSRLPHVLDGFLAFAKELGIQDLTPDWQLPISAEHQAWAREKLDGKPTLLICAAASKAFKNWTAEGYATLADHAASKGFQVYLCGGPAKLERDLAADIQRLSQSQPVDLVGQTNLKQLLALIKEASLVLAPDTGPTHMATLVGTPVIGLYAHHNPDRTGPYLCREHAVSVYQEFDRAGDRQAAGGARLAYPPQGS